MSRPRAARAGRRLGRGMTFVELLIAVAIVAIVGVGLSSQLRGGLTVWRRSHEQGEQAQRLRVTWLRLSRDLANAVIVEPADLEDSETEWSTERLAFYTTDPPADPALPPRVSLVSYEVRAPESTDPPAPGREAPAVNALVRTARLATAEETRESVLLTGVEALRLEYPFREDAADPGSTDWAFAATDWPVEQSLPRAVRVSLVFAEPEGQPEEARTWRRVASIPTGTVPQESAE